MCSLQEPKKKKQFIRKKRRRKYNLPSFFFFIKKIRKEFSQVESKDSAQRVKGQERKVKKITQLFESFQLENYKAKF